MFGFKVIMSRQDGFSLVELMVVIGIIGILATIAMPKYQQFSARSKATEAKVNLKYAYMLQENNHMVGGAYDTLAMVGFSPTGNMNFGYKGPEGAQNWFTVYACSAIDGACSGVPTAEVGTIGRLASCQTGDYQPRINQNNQFFDFPIPGC